jgi:prevent-host-death family protein
MQIVSANEAKTHFGKLLDDAQRGPVQIARHNRTVGVMVSAEDYAAMRAFYANRLQQTLTQSAETAAAEGLSEAELERLLANES